MPVAIGLELDRDDRAIAWALDYPGCFAYGKDGTEAVVAMARALVNYEAWANRHGGEGWLSLGDYDLRLVDTWQDYKVNPEYDVDPSGRLVESFFLADWKPLTEAEIQRALTLLTWSRQDVLHITTDLSPEQLDHTLVGERWSIRGVLGHIAHAESWYMTRLGQPSCEPFADPQDVFTNLAAVRAAFNAFLPQTAGKEWVMGKRGEMWSPRKVLRRALMHEIDHIQHIHQLL